MSRQIILVIIITFSYPVISEAQEQPFSLQDCISYALENNTDIGRAKNTVKSQNAYLELSKAARLPDLQLDASKQFNSASQYSTIENRWSRVNTTTLRTSLNSQVTLYSGAKLINTIRQNQIHLEAAELNIQTEQELISLNILFGYIDVLLAKDYLRNSQLQLEATQNQLEYTNAQKEVGAISLSDLLKIKSQWATQKAASIEAENNLRITLVSLMQLMNMPVSSNLDIQKPNIDKLIASTIETNPQRVYEIALGIKPNIKSANLQVESAEFGTRISKADALPNMNLNGGIGTSYASSLNEADLGEQFSNSLNPYVGLSLVVPIFQRKQIKTQVELAQIQVVNSELELTDTKNNLRKYIEQVCTEAQTAQSNYLALQEQLKAENESYEVANEMFTQGMIASVDFLLSKNNLIVAENKFTEAKYNLILKKKNVEYYFGNTISL